MKVLAVASAGGHWVQLLRLSHAFEGHELIYISTKAGFGSMVEGHEFHLIQDSNRKNKFGLIKTFAQVVKLVAKIKPELIITTGAAPGLMCIVAGRVLGIRTVWIDSIANVEELSMSGKIAAKVAHVVYTQWPDLAKGRIKYSGNILS
ncbi:MAG: oligosaccharide biosynthesis protein Alg14 [Flavobacteriales bacterium]|nr:MAG: oligosaccharide biosynthesis protein Alg14 [Flavobacteriales bacterium]